MLKAPSLSKQINGQQLLWFSCSNSYIIAHKDINKLINLFVSNSKKSFFIRAASEIMEVPRSQSEIYYEEIKHFLSADPTKLRAENSPNKKTLKQAWRFFVWTIYS